MENIDISKIKNISNSLTDSEIFELNAVLNKDDTRDIINQMYESEKKENREFFVGIGIIFIIIVMISGIQVFIGERDIFKIVMVTLFIFFIGGFLLYIGYVYMLILGFGKKSIENRVLQGKQELSYGEKKQLLLRSLGNSSILKFATLTENINHEEMIQLFQDRGIFEMEHKRCKIEDLLIVSHRDERLILGEWKAYKRISKYKEKLKNNKLFFVKNFIKSTIFSSQVLIEKKKTLWEGFLERLNRIIYECIFFSLVLGFCIFLFTPEGKEILGIYDEIGVFVLLLAWILIDKILFLFKLVFKKKKRQMTLVSSGLFKNFSIYSDNPQTKITFENPQIQQIFIDFFKNTKYRYEIFITDKEIVVIRDVESEFLEFHYKNDINMFIKPFVDFYIEQKHIFQFLENIKILYK